MQRFLRPSLHVLMGACIGALFTVDLWGRGRVFDWAALRIITDVLLLGVFVPWLVYRAVSRRPVVSGPLDAPLSALLGALLLSSLLAAVRAAVPEPLLMVAMLILWFKLASEMAAGRIPYFGERWLSAALLVASAGYALTALLEFTSWYAGLPPSDSGVSWLETGAGILPPAFPQTWLVYGPNVVGGYLAMLLPLALAGVWAAHTLRSRALHGAWLALAAPVLWLAQSRSVWLSLGAACAAFLALLATGRVHLPAIRRGRMLIPLVGAISLAAVLLISLDRLGSSLQRVYLWTETLRLWAGHPLFGIGPGNFVYAQLPPERSLGSGGVFLNAHNLPLQALVMTGACGVAAGVWLLWRLLASARDSWRAAGAEGRPRLAALIAGLAAFGVWNLTDTHPQSFLLSGTAALLAALLLAHRPQSLQSSNAAQGPSGTYRLLLAGAAAGLCGAAFLIEREHVDMANAESLLAAGRPSEAATLLREAAGRSPAGAFYLWQLGLAEAEAGDWPAADAAYQAAARDVFPWAAPVANAAYSAAMTGDTDRAQRLAAQAMVLAPDDPRYPLLLGRLLEAEGDREDATRAYARAVALQPEALASTFWETEVRGGMLPAILAEAEIMLREDEALVAPRRAALLSDLLARQGRWEEAEGVLTTALAQNEPVQQRLTDEIGRLLHGPVQDAIERERELFNPALSRGNLWAALGMVRIHRGNLAGAAMAFENAGRSSPANPLAYAGRSALALVEGDAPAAVRNGRLAVLYGGRREAYAALGRALLLSGSPEQAIPYLERGSRPVRVYFPYFGLTFYDRRELLPNLLPAIPDPAPDRDLAPVLDDLAAAYARVGNEPGRRHVEERLAALQTHASVP